MSKDDDIDLFEKRKAAARRRSEPFQEKVRTLEAGAEKFPGRLPRLSLADLERHPEYLSAIAIVRTKRYREPWREVGKLWGPGCESFTLYAPLL